MPEAKNNTVITFGASTVADTNITHVGLHLGSSGTDGFLVAIPLEVAVALPMSDEHEIVVDDLVIDQPTATGETDAMAERALEGRIAGTMYGSLHSADPGITGANEISLQSRAVITNSLWDIE